MILTRVFVLNDRNVRPIVIRYVIIESSISRAFRLSFDLATTVISIGSAWRQAFVRLNNGEGFGELRKAASGSIEILFYLIVGQY